MVLDDDYETDPGNEEKEVREAPSQSVLAG